MLIPSYLVLLGSFAATGLTVATCPTATTCKGVVGLAATALKGYAPAETYCTTKYPVARQTCTSTALAATVTSTVATNTITAKVTNTVTVTSAATITQTNIITPTITSQSITIETDTLTETDTATVTVTVTLNLKQKRSEVTARAVDPKSSQLSSLKAQASAFVGSVCTCLEKPASTTVTTTPKVTSSVTATATVSSTATLTATVTAFATITTNVNGPAVTVTATSTSTTTTTTTTIVTTTATVTANPAPPASDSRIRCDFDDLNSCSDNCLCDPIGSGPDIGKAFCLLGGAFTTKTCASNADCAASEFCDTDVSRCGQSAGCTSSFVPSRKRGVGSGLFAGSMVGRMNLKPKKLVRGV